jgi:iron complex outermembrane receptor protein
MKRSHITSTALVAFSVLTTGAAQASPDMDELADLSLEQLGNVVVTSVSRQQERLSDAAASVFVIGAGDIRRSGVRTIPEALRLAPNLQVAKVDARNYAITARGSNSPFENKLLVLIDGRSIYSPLFSGVFWDAQDVVMEDIERIEVISGPGATIWGANAVNGVINIITRNARDSTGGLASAAAGEHQRDGALRYGGALGEDGHYRVYGKYAQADDTLNLIGEPTETGWRREQAGFRADWSHAGTALTASGDVYQGWLRQAGTPEIRIAGANLLGRVERQLDNAGSLRLDVILDHTERNQPNAFDEHLDTLDLQLQHGLRLGERQHLIWGAGYRYAWDTVVNAPAFGFLPGDMNLHWGNVFAQDEIALTPALKLTAGLKYEHDSYVGGEYLPSLRLAWNAAPSTLLWSSLTRSVRSPSRIDRDLFAPSQPLIIKGKPFFAIGGGPDFQSEVAKTAELGYRFQPRAEWSYSATLYYTDYARLRTLEPLPAGSFAGSVFSNLGEGTVRGVEMWGLWQPLPVWRMNAGLVVQRLRTGLLPGSRDSSGDSGLATNDPSHHWMLRSSLDLSEQLMLDLHLRHTGSLPKPLVPAYTELEMQLLWKPRADIDIALLGQNLLHPSHAEFGGGGRSVVERTVLLKLSKRF